MMRVALLVLCGVVYGAAGALLFRRFTNRLRIQRTINRLLAHIMEFGLFLDEPGLILRAQWGALRANLTLLRLIAIPCVMMAGLFACVYVPMESYFGHGSLRTGESTVLTARIDHTLQIEGIVIETPGVRIPRTGEVSWRVRTVQSRTGALPRGFELRYPKSRWWALWFLTISSVSALAVSIQNRIPWVSLFK